MIGSGTTFRTEASRGGNSGNMASKLVVASEQNGNYSSQTNTTGAPAPFPNHGRGFPMSILRVLAVAAILWLPVHVAWADDNPSPRTDCPSLNGTWKVRYGFDKMGAPVDVTPLRPWPKLLVTAHFDGNTAVLTWFNGRSERFRLTKDYGRPERSFEGISPGGYIISAVVISDPSPGYPIDKCYLSVLEFFSEKYFINNKDSGDWLLEKIK